MVALQWVRDADSLVRSPATGKARNIWIQVEMRRNRSVNGAVLESLQYKDIKYGVVRLCQVHQSVVFIRILLMNATDETWITGRAASRSFEAIHA